MQLRRFSRALTGVAATVLAARLHGQSWDLPSRLDDKVSQETDEKLKFGVESRFRYENRTGNAFGRNPDISVALVRTRLAATFKPLTWLKFSGMLQDSRAPGYGPNAPNTVRDPVDLHESYFELFGDREKGFVLSAGRRMLNYGESRLIGCPQWGNLSRTFDFARAYYKTPRAQVELLFVSPVKIQIGEFNRPILGDRVWGTYNSFPDVWKKNRLDFYILRRNQNRPGGFASGNRQAETDRLGINTFGLRMTGPLAWKAKYSAEAALQNGKVAGASHFAHAWFSALSRRWTVDGRPLDVSGEYKFASGSRDPQNTTLSRTFDQLYAANHDKFGHQDLFGWRNVHNARSLATYGITKALSLNLMYNSLWLASSRDALYSGSGAVIVRSANGSAGRHVGQEADVFATYKYGNFLLGAGYGHFFAGGFINNTTPRVGPAYVYFFHTYTL